MRRTTRSRATFRAGCVATALVLLAACSSGDDDATGQAKPTASSTTDAARGTGDTSTDASGNACDQGATMDEIDEAPVEGVASDRTLTSFDGTEIRTHWFPAPGATAEEPAPTVLMGPGWSLAGDTSTDGAALFGALGIGPMNDRGYNVLTWDPRGFGESGGRATVDDPAHEGRDAQMLLDWVAARPEAMLDRDGDPRVGMVGFSYGGGIQLVLAAMDCRVDAIVPGIAWHSLVTSLGKADTLKEGWSGFLVGTVDPDHVDPHVTGAYESGRTTGTVSDEDREWFESRGPGDRIDDVSVPTLFIQGTVDTLFTLDEAITNFRSLRDRQVPVKMLWFCGGHGTCLTDAGDQSRVGEASFAWLDRYVKGDASVDTGPTVDVIDQDGTRWTGDTYPPESGEPLSAEGSGILDLVADGGAGPLAVEPPPGDPLGGLVGDITPFPATNDVSVAVAAAEDSLVLGAPKLSLTYRGTVDPGTKPTRVFAQLVDDERNVVVGNQITPIEVILDGRSHTTEVDLEVVAQYLEAGESLTLELVAATTAYSVPRLGGEITFEHISIELPTTTAQARG